MTIFCGISPVGIGIGIVLKESGENGGAALLVFQGLATGSLIYVVFFEILEKERAKAINGFAQAMSMTMGYLFMVGLSFLEAEYDGETETTASPMFNSTVSHMYNTTSHMFD